MRQFRMSVPCFLDARASARSSVTVAARIRRACAAARDASAVWRMEGVLGTAAAKEARAPSAAAGCIYAHAAWMPTSGTGTGVMEATAASLARAAAHTRTHRVSRQRVRCKPATISCASAPVRVIGGGPGVDASDAGVPMTVAAAARRADAAAVLRFARAARAFHRPARAAAIAVNGTRGCDVVPLGAAAA